MSCVSFFINIIIKLPFVLIIFFIFVFFSLIFLTKNVRFLGKWLMVDFKHSFIYFIFFPCVFYGYFYLNAKFPFALLLYWNIVNVFVFFFLFEEVCWLVATHLLNDYFLNFFFTLLLCRALKIRFLTITNVVVVFTPILFSFALTY